MARIAFYNLLGANGSLTDFYDPATLTVLGTPTATRETLVDTASQNEIIFNGHDLTYDNGLITGGTINKITFRQGEGSALLSVTQHDYDAATLAATLIDGGLSKMVKLMLAGNDAVVGSGVADTMSGFGGKDLMKGNGGADIIAGGRGNDTLYGGDGSDLFVFKAGDGKDVIRDFDGIGGGVKQDHIGAAFKDVDKFITDHHNVILDFGHGDQITLFHVDRADISAADFQL